MIRMFLFCVASHKNSSQNQSNCGIFDSRVPNYRSIKNIWTENNTHKNSVACITLSGFPNLFQFP